MAIKKLSSIERLLERIDTLDAATLASLSQRLGRERGLFERVFNVLQEGVLVLDAEGEIAYINAAARRLLGLPADEGLAAMPTLWRMIPGLRALLAPALQAHTSLTRELELSYPEPRAVRLYLVPFATPSAALDLDAVVETQRFAVVFTDVTRDKLNTDQRIESERVASIMLLAAGVAHELGNPLNSLTIHLQVVERKLGKLRGIDKKDVASLADSLRVCQDEVARLDGIIAHFLQAIRPRPPELADTYLTEVLAEVLDFQRHELEDRGITVEVAIPADPPLVRADRDQARQAFFNVIKNAAEAMSPGDRLQITARVDEQCLSLAFSDTGCGIKPVDLARLFEPYHTTKPGGHGLGMMVVQRIMTAHGGQITVQSTVGEGTTVTLQFPLKNRLVRLLGSS